MFVAIDMQREVVSALDVIDALAVILHQQGDQSPKVIIIEDTMRK